MKDQKLFFIAIAIFILFKFKDKIFGFGFDSSDDPISNKSFDDEIKTEINKPTVEVLKLGSKGENVLKLQKLLNTSLNYIKLIETEKGNVEKQYIDRINFLKKSLPFSLIFTFNQKCLYKNSICVNFLFFIFRYYFHLFIF